MYDRSDLSFVTGYTSLLLSSPGIDILSLMVKSYLFSHLQLGTYYSANSQKWVGVRTDVAGYQDACAYILYPKYLRDKSRKQ